MCKINPVCGRREAELRLARCVECGLSSLRRDRYRSCQHRTRQGERPQSGSFNKNDIHWRRDYVSGPARPLVSPAYKL